MGHGKRVCMIFWWFFMKHKSISGSITRLRYGPASGFLLDARPLKGFQPNPATGNSNVAQNKLKFPVQIGSDERVPKTGDRLGSQTILESPKSVDTPSLVSGNTDAC